MVNRRLLRIKAMQALYAFKQAERSNYQLALDFISETFQPDLNSMLPQDRQKLEGLRQLATLAFEEDFAGKHSDEEIHPKSLKVAHEAMLFYKKNTQHDRQHIGKSMVDEVESIYNNYIKILAYLIELADIAVWDETRRIIETPTKTSRLGNNQVIKALSQHPDFQDEAIRRHVKVYDEQRNTLRQVFSDGLLPDELFLKYISKTIHTFEEDLEMANHIVKSILLKNVHVIEELEEKDSFWNENKEVLKSLLIKTFKIDSLESLKLMPLAMNWEDDRYYFTDLFNHTLNNETEYEAHIMAQTQNWEGDRLAMTDMIILKLALSEMFNFPSIPVKVTINEFIELAKEYSTPKSGHFINGILDALSIKLLKENLIRKSGRGLIDNR